MPNTVTDERDLLVQLRGGSHAAFEVIYNRYKRGLAGSMLRLLKTPELVDDLLQELFVRLWEHRHAIDPDRAIKSYLFRIAENLIYDTFRRFAMDKKIRDQVFKAMSEELAQADKYIIERENQEVIHRAIALLPPKRRLVFVMCKLEAKSYEEVSNVLNISLSTINDHIYKANQFIRKYLRAQAVMLLIAVFNTLPS